MRLLIGVLGSTALMGALGRTKGRRSRIVGPDDKLAEFDSADKVSENRKRDLFSINNRNTTSMTTLPWVPWTSFASDSIEARHGITIYRVRKTSLQRSTFGL